MEMTLNAQNVSHLFMEIIALINAINVLGKLAIWKENVLMKMINARIKNIQEICA